MKHYLQPGHCGLGSLLGQAETQRLGEALRSTTLQTYT